MSVAEDPMALALRLAAEAERMAAIATHLRALDGAAVAPELREPLARIAEGALPGLADLDPDRRRAVAGVLGAFLRQAADLLEHPDREPGWLHDDPMILEAQGRASMSLAPVLGEAAEGLGELRRRLDLGGAVCDVGTGVGWLAIGAAGVWPRARVVGIDIHRPALLRAGANVAGAGLAHRIELRPLDVRSLADPAGGGFPPATFDLVWLPGPFLPKAVVPEALAATACALGPGGWVAFGLYGGPTDPDSVALSDLRTIRSGGHPWAADEVGAALSDAGFTSVRELARTWSAPVRLVVGARP